MKTILLFVILSFGACFASYCQIPGKVVSVHDGDTFTFIDTAGVKYKVRVYGVQCYEVGQPYAKQATEYTKSMLLNNSATLDIKARDKYGRVVAVVCSSGKCLNELLLQNGYAWHYRRFDTNSHYQALEDEAKLNKRGFWCGFQ